MSYGAIQSRVDCNFVKVFENTITQNSNGRSQPFQTIPTGGITVDKMPQFIIYDINYKINSSSGSNRDFAISIRRTGDTGGETSADILNFRVGQGNFNLQFSNVSIILDVVSVSYFFDYPGNPSFKYGNTSNYGYLYLETNWENDVYTIRNIIDISNTPYVYADSGINYTLEYSTWIGSPFSTIDGK